MGDVFVELLPLLIGAAILPVYIIIVLVLLTGQQGAARAAAFLGGATLTRIVQGVLFGFVFGSGGDGDKGRVVPVLLTVVGILLLIAAWAAFRKQPDPDDPPPAWMEKVAGLTVVGAFGMGAALVAVAPKLWVFTLSVLGVLEEAQLGPARSVALYGLYMGVAVLLSLLPLLVALVAPQGSASTLVALRGWMERNNRVIKIVVSVVFGFFFLSKGIAGLMG